MRALGVFLFLSCGVACAQIPATSAANPNTAAQRGATDVIAPVPAPPPAVPRVSSIAVPELATKADPSDAAHVDVKSIVVEGADALDPKELRRNVAKYERRTVTLGQLRKLTIRIGNALRQRGYFLARASLPPQDVSSGVVRIVVSSGRFGQLRVAGEQHYSEEFVRRMFSPAMRTAGVNRGALERALLVLDEFPDLVVKARFEPGAKPGQSDCVLRVKDAAPFHVGLDYNDFGNRLVGRNQAGIAVWGGNALTDGDELFVRLVRPFPTDGEPIYQASYTLPVGAAGDRIAAHASRARTRVGGALAPLDIRGEADLYALVWLHPVERLLTRANGFQFGLASKSVRNTVFGGTPVSADELREVTVAYSGYAVDRDGQFVHSTVLTQGLGTLFGGSPNGGPLASRLLAGDGFTRINSDVVRTYGAGARNRWYLRGSLQYSVKPLTTAEMFAVGGADSVRGFIPAEYLGDDGYFASAEFRHRFLAARPGRRLDLEGLVFVDQGGGTLNHPVGGSDGSRDLTGAGVGLRANAGKATSARLDLGFPVSVGRNAQGDDALLYGQLVTRF